MTWPPPLRPEIELSCVVLSSGERRPPHARQQMPDRAALFSAALLPAGVAYCTATHGRVSA